MQFPWVALANCGSKYLDGISLKGQADSLGAGRLSKQVSKNPKKVQYDSNLPDDNSLRLYDNISLPPCTTPSTSTILGILSYVPEDSKSRSRLGEV